MNGDLYKDSQELLRAITKLIEDFNAKHDTIYARADVDLLIKKPSEFPWIEIRMEINGEHAL